MSTTIDNASELVWLRGKAVKFIAKLETAEEKFQDVALLYSFYSSQFTVSTV